MFSKNNRKMILKRTEKRKLRYSIKKLSVGVASVLVGIYIGFGGAESGNAQVVNESMEKPIVVEETIAAEAPVTNEANEETIVAEAPVTNEANEET
ncbi:YSIRK-type signal peptide-containing protein, partial [Enterococcus sp. 5B3_DIV0040]|uniref:YSIRK-type signal peptide-containing protein n=1 Tax=Enterococcus sp. 5B3_DIV0040 TaxID=1834182 RepID=UPI000B6B8EAC